MSKFDRYGRILGVQVVLFRSLGRRGVRRGLFLPGNEWQARGRWQPMWFRCPQPLIGIDIGSHAIKLAAFGLSGGSFQLLNLAMLPLPPDTVADGVIADISAMQGLLRRLIALEKITSKDVALALSGHSVIVKKVSMVRMSEEELANAMPYEAEHVWSAIQQARTNQ